MQSLTALADTGQKTAKTPKYGRRSQRSNGSGSTLGECRAARRRAWYCHGRWQGGPAIVSRCRFATYVWLMSGSVVRERPVNPSMAPVATSTPPQVVSHNVPVGESGGAPPAVSQLGNMPVETGSKLSK